MTEFKGMTLRHGVKIGDIHRKYGIPHRTLQGWYYGQRKPPQYVLNLLEEALTRDFGLTNYER